jgi:hypothetical protein
LRRAPAVFTRAVVNRDCEALVWPNAGDLAPESLYDAVKAQPGSA